MFGLDHRGFPWHGSEKSEIKNLGGNEIFENTERKNDCVVEKLGRENYVIWYNKDSDSIHVDPNHTNSNQTIPANFTSIESIHDSADIRSIENIFSSPVHLVRSTNDFL